MNANAYVTTMSRIQNPTYTSLYLDVLVMVILSSLFHRYDYCPECAFCKPVTTDSKRLLRQLPPTRWLRDMTARSWPSPATLSRYL